VDLNFIYRKAVMFTIEITWGRQWHSERLREQSESCTVRRSPMLSTSETHPVWCQNACCCY